MGPGSERVMRKAPSIRICASLEPWIHAGLGFKADWLDWLFLRHSRHDAVMTVQ